jgi:hypothetical protein
MAVSSLSNGGGYEVQSGRRSMSSTRPVRAATDSNTHPRVVGNICGAVITESNEGLSPDQLAGFPPVIVTGLLHGTESVAISMDSVERREIRDPVANLGSIQVQFGGQSVDGHRFVECLEDFELMVVPIRQSLDVGFGWRGHPVPLLEFNQGLVREGRELIVAQPVDLSLGFRLDDIVVEPGLYQLIHILDVVVTPRDQFEQEDILVAYSKVGRLIDDENSLETIGNSPFRAGKGYGSEAF